jgi:arylsulfatase
MPTLAEIVGVKVPEDACGISFLPALKEENQRPHEYLYWEHSAYGGQMAVRMGNLKALRKNMNEGNLKWELFDLEKDPGETTDISEAHPEVIARIKEIVSKEHTVSANERWRFEALGEK